MSIKIWIGGLQNGDNMPINRVSIPNSEPVPVLTEKQRRRLDATIKNPIEISSQAFRRVLRSPSRILDIGGPGTVGTKGSLIDLMI